MLQRWIIAKVAGELGERPHRVFQEWDKTRFSRATEVHEEEDDWPDAVRTHVDGLAESLPDHRAEPPILFCAEWVDAWSMSDLIPASFPAGSPAIEVDGHKFCSACYRLPDGGALVGHLQRTLRRKQTRERNPQESRWFVLNLLEAAHAWEKCAEKAAIIILREVCGGAWLDEQVAANLKTEPDWFEA